MHSDTLKRVFLAVVLLLYIAVLSKFILFKQSPAHIVRELRKDFTEQRIKKNFRSANLQPGKTIQLYLKSHLPSKTIFANIGGNIIGFIPFGFLVPMLIPFFRKSLLMILSGFLFSLYFECAQLVTGLGHFDVDDLILNTVGVMIGLFVFKIAAQKKSRTRGTFSLQV